MDTRDSKSLLREGDSWRARVYRKKDELFTFGQERLAEFLKGLQPDASSKISNTITSLNKPLQVLRENAESGEAGQEALDIIEKIGKELDEAGFKRG